MVFCLVDTQQVPPNIASCNKFRRGRNLSLAAASNDTAAGELSGIHRHYAALIAAARATMRPDQAALAIHNLRNEQTLAIRNVKNRKEAERANRREPHRPEAFPRAPLRKSAPG